MIGTILLSLLCVLTLLFVLGKIFGGMMFHLSNLGLDIIVLLAWFAYGVTRIVTG